MMAYSLECSILAKYLSELNGQVQDVGCDTERDQHILDVANQLLFGSTSQERGTLRPVEPIFRALKQPNRVAAASVRSDSNQNAHIERTNWDPKQLTHMDIQSLMALSQIHLTNVAARHPYQKRRDISQHEEAKLFAAISGCLRRIFDETSDEQLSRDAERFAIFSVDFSGIQEFIYTISSKGALKALRTRSLFLDIMIENLADEILDACQLTRCNLLYTGGGNAFLLLPNVASVLDEATSCVKRMNDVLLERFGARLYVQCGCSACSVSTLLGDAGAAVKLAEVYESIAVQMDKMKNCRYDADGLQRLNKLEEQKVNAVPCTTCGMAVESMGTQETDDVQCELCSAFQAISNKLAHGDCLLCISSAPDSDANASVRLPSPSGNQFMTVVSMQAYDHRHAHDVRVYHRGTAIIPGVITLFWGDYAAKNNEKNIKSFQELAEGKEGIARLGAVRMDVDGLGLAFREGFDEGDSNILRYCALSRSLTRFFKLRVPERLDKAKAEAVLIYAGGDDLFLVGVWKDVLNASVDISAAFEAYTGKVLTISAGIGSFGLTYPLVRLAEETAGLEDAAKKHSADGQLKNAVSLFGKDMCNGALKALHTYHWDTFSGCVLGEKLKAIETCMNTYTHLGTTWLHRLLSLVRESQHDRMPLARLAYFLARSEPSVPRQREAYRVFINNLYGWTSRESDRNQLVTALLIYLYNTRISKKEGIEAHGGEFDNPR